MEFPKLNWRFQCRCSCMLHKDVIERSVYTDRQIIFNKNVGIKFSAHDALLEYSSSGTLKDKIN